MPCLKEDDPMKRVIPYAVFVVMIAAFVSLPLAKSPQVPAPGPELKRLGFFVGKWRGEGEMKPSPFGPGGKFTESDDSEWMPGGFFVVIHADETSPMGSGKALMIMGYNAEKKVYTFNAFNSMGLTEAATGIVEGDTWTWTSDSEMGGKPVKTRYTMKELSPTSYSTKFEMSADGGAWMTIMEGKTTKVPVKP
jgi:hypothetical protein